MTEQQQRYIELRRKLFAANLTASEIKEMSQLAIGFSHAEKLEIQETFGVLAFPVPVEA